MATVRWFDARYTRYNWQGLSELEGLGSKASTGAGNSQLKPFCWLRRWLITTGVVLALLTGLC